MEMNKTEKKYRPKIEKPTNEIVFNVFLLFSRTLCKFNSEKLIGWRKQPVCENISVGTTFHFRVTDGLRKSIKLVKCPRKRVWDNQSVETNSFDKATVCVEKFLKGDSLS